MIDLSEHVHLKDTRFGAAWVFECPGCGEELLHFDKTTCLRAAASHARNCAGFSTA